jgi:hypothetical protein
MNKYHTALVPNIPMQSAIAAAVVSKSRLLVASAYKMCYSMQEDDSDWELVPGGRQRRAGQQRLAHARIEWQGSWQKGQVSSKVNNQCPGMLQYYTPPVLTSCTCLCAAGFHAKAQAGQLSIRSLIMRRILVWLAECRES